LILGAGASFRSGIPVAAEAVKQIVRAAYARHVRGLPERQCNLTTSDWLPYLRQQPWFLPDPTRLAENFPLAVEHLLHPKEFRHEVFMDMISRRTEVNKGYKHLANLMMRRLCWNVLTTNFDSLPLEALREKRAHFPEIVEVRTPDDLVRFSLNKRCQVIFLHGSVEHYRDQNLINETQRLDYRLVQRIRPLLNESPVIVIGYRGAEPSIMQHLLYEGADESHNYRHGLYWCTRNLHDIHPNVEKLQQKLGDNFRLLQIEGFDELLEALDRELECETWYSPAEGSTQSSIAASLTTPYDSRPLEGATLANLDHDLMLATFTDYCKRLSLAAANQNNLLPLMCEQGLLVMKDGTAMPTTACYLLFGIDVSERFPYAKIAFTRNGKKRKVFEGNLMSQFRNLLNYLNSEEINPLLRVKRNRKAESQPAYPERAIVEMIVNLLVHRDYEVQSYSTVEFEPGQFLRFSNPGGLMSEVLRQVCVGADGSFSPIRGLTVLRNPRLADIFYGIGSMDKAGSGLPDADRLMREFGGKAEFLVGTDNESLQIALFQAVQSSPETSRVATPLSVAEIFITNHLPFLVLPTRISVLPLRERPLHYMPLFEPEENPADCPVFIRHGGKLLTFADLSQFPRFAEKRGLIENLQRLDLAEFIANEDQRRLFVWLLAKHWEFFLRRFNECGIYVEFKRKRAYFRLMSGEGNTVTYDSAQRKNVKREVVKKRLRGERVEFENEGIAYSVVEFAGQWAVRIKPFYLFTRSDGCTPLPSFLQSRRSTSRIKFDRNKSVGDDLLFWARFLSEQRPAINLGGVGVTDLIASSEYCSVEAQRAEPEGT